MTLPGCPYYHVRWASVAGWQNPPSAYWLHTCTYWPCQRSWPCVLATRTYVLTTGLPSYDFVFTEVVARWLTSILHAGPYGDSWLRWFRVLPVSRSSVEGVNIIVIQTTTRLADGCIVTLCYTVDAVGASGIYYTNCRSLGVIAWC